MELLERELSLRHALFGEQALPASARVLVIESAFLLEFAPDWTARAVDEVWLLSADEAAARIRVAARSAGDGPQLEEAEVQQRQDSQRRNLLPFSTRCVPRPAHLHPQPFQCRHAA